MTPDADDQDSFSPPPPSLATRAVRWARGVKAASPATAEGGRWVVVALAALIAAGPLATMLGAAVLARAVQHDSAVLAAQQAPRRAAARSRAAAHAVLSAAIVRPGPAALLDGVAVALPADAAMARAERRPDGMLELEIAVSDPDALRGALRRVPALAHLRDVRQQEGEGRTLVLLRQVAR